MNKQLNVECRNELGRLPLKEIANVNTIKFWLHLENKQDDHYAKQCLQISKDMAEKWISVGDVGRKCHNNGLVTGPLFFVLPTSRVCRTSREMPRS